MYIHMCLNIRHILLAALIGIIVGVVSTHYVDAYSNAGCKPSEVKKWFPLRRTEESFQEYLEQLEEAPVLEELRPAAPGGQPAFDLSHCEGLTGKRLANCMGAYFKSGTVYPLYE